MAKVEHGADGIGTADGAPDPDAAADGDRSGDRLSISVGDDAGSGTDTDAGDRRDDGRAAGAGAGAGSGSGKRGAGRGVRSAGSRKRAGGSKRKSSSASRTREASLAVDAKPKPRGAAAKAAIPAKAFGDLAGVAFAITATRRGEHWKLSADESQALGDAIAGVVKHVPLPERELGIAADIAALGFVVYAITVPRIEADRVRAQQLAAATNVVRPTTTPAAPLDVERAGLQRMEQAIRERLGGVPLDLRNPQHVAVLNELADEGLVASGSAVGGSGQPPFTNNDPTQNGAIVNDPNAVIEGLDPS